jgi:hypothetical protein
MYVNSGSISGVISAAPINDLPAVVDDSGSNVGAIVGGVVGGVAFIVLVVVVYCCCCGKGGGKGTSVPQSHVRFDDDFVMAQAVGSGVMTNMEEMLLTPLVMDRGPIVIATTATVNGTVVVDPKVVDAVVAQQPSATATTHQQPDGHASGTVDASIML